jgi:hypothetical protein
VTIVWSVRGRLRTLTDTVSRPTGRLALHDDLRTWLRDAEAIIQRFYRSAAYEDVAVSALAMPLSRCLRVLVGEGVGDALSVGEEAGGAGEIVAGRPRSLLGHPAHGNLGKPAAAALRGTTDCGVGERCGPAPARPR